MRCEYRRLITPKYEWKKYKYKNNNNNLLKTNNQNSKKNGFFVLEKEMK